ALQPGGSVHGEMAAAAGPAKKRGWVLLGAGIAAAAGLSVVGRGMMKPRPAPPPAVVVVEPAAPVVAAPAAPVVAAPPPKVDPPAVTERVIEAPPEPKKKSHHTPRVAAPAPAA